MLLTDEESQAWGFSLAHSGQRSEAEPVCTGERQDGETLNMTSEWPPGVEEQSKGRLCGDDGLWGDLSGEEDLNADS